MAVESRRDSNGSSSGHDIERIYEQVDENALHPLTVHSYDELLGDILNDLYGLSVGNNRYFAHCAGYQLTNTGRLQAYVRASVARQSLV